MHSYSAFHGTVTTSDVNLEKMCEEDAEVYLQEKIGETKGTTNNFIRLNNSSR
jgi:hypothetical protein